MTNLVALLTALSALLTTMVSAAVLVREIRKNRRATVVATRATLEVHAMVDGQATADKAYRLLLSDTLRRHGIVVPIDPAAAEVDH